MNSTDFARGLRDYALGHRVEKRLHEEVSPDEIPMGAVVLSEDQVRLLLALAGVMEEEASTTNVSWDRLFALLKRALGDVR